MVQLPETTFNVLLGLDSGINVGKLKSKIRTIFAHYYQKPSVFGTIITNLPENGVYYAILTYKKNINLNSIENWPF